MGYPVKSMMGEELNASLVTDRGLLGDRAYALMDRETGKVVSAKEPRKWAKLFEFRSMSILQPGTACRLSGSPFRME
jgi:MOSC domain-containing protein